MASTTAPWGGAVAPGAVQAFNAASAASAESTLAHLSALRFRYNLWQEAIAVCRRAADLSASQ